MSKFHALFILFVGAIFGIFFYTKLSSHISTIPIFSMRNCILDECLQNIDSPNPKIDSEKILLTDELLISTLILQTNARQITDRFGNNKLFSTLQKSETKNLQYLTDLMEKYSATPSIPTYDMYLPNFDNLHIAYGHTLKAEENRQKMIVDKILTKYDTTTDLGRIAKMIHTESTYYHIPTLRRYAQSSIPSPTISK